MAVEAWTLSSDRSHVGKRQAWMRILARCDVGDLQSYWNEVKALHKVTVVRKPESGTVMVRAFVGGTNTRFNFGEATLTRCSVVLNECTVGHGYVLGRNKTHAELAATFDALLQDAGRHGCEQHLRFVQSLGDRHRKARIRRARKVASTRVNFLTMLKEEER